MTTTLDTTPTDVDDPQENTWRVPAYKIDRFRAAIAKANRRLERAGHSARFEFHYEDIQVPTTTGGIIDQDGRRLGGVVVYQPWVVATLMSPLTLTLGDYTFKAALAAEEGGIVVHSAPGHDLGGYVPAGDDHCDHCHVSRRRTRLYLVRDNATGELLQLGHSCVELFTGLSPKGLWALQFDGELDEFTEDDGVGGGFSTGVLGADVDVVLAVAFAYSDRGRRYVSTARTWPGGPASTVSQVREHIFGGPPRSSNYKRLEDYLAALAEYDAREAEAKAIAADADLIAAIRASVETVTVDSDYGRNLRVLLAGESVSGRSLGVLASLVAVYAREKELAAKRAAAPARVQGFLAEVGIRIKEPIELSLTVVRYGDTGYGTTSTWVVGVTPDGHVATWKASKDLDVEAGDTLVLSAATVRAHENYQGTDQTVLTRAVVAETRHPE